MKATISLDGLLAYIQSMSLNAKSLKWLGNKLIETANEKEHKELEFPSIPKDWKVSQKVMDMSIGSLPNGIDWDKETDKMWEDFAK